MKTTLVLLVLWLALMLAGSAVTPVHAATPNGCLIVGTVGNVEVALCEDEDTGLMVWANSAGMLQVIE